MTEVILFTYNDLKPVNKLINTRAEENLIPLQHFCQLYSGHPDGHRYPVNLE